MTHLPLIQLVNDSGKPYDFVVNNDLRTYADLIKSGGLAEIAAYAQGIGANKNLIVPCNSTGKLLPPTSLIADAHQVRLLVHAWTFRNENFFLPVDFRIDDVEKCMDRKTGTAEIFNSLIFPYLPDIYEDLHSAVRKADLLVTHPLPVVGPIVRPGAR